MHKKPNARSLFEKSAMAANLAYMRKHYGYTLKEISETIGIPVKSYFNYESGISGMSEERLKMVCEFWHVTPEELSTKPSEFKKIFILKR